VDPPDHLDLGLRPTSYVFTVVGVAGALAFTVLSMALAWAAAAAGMAQATSINGAAERAIDGNRDWLHGVISPSLAFAGTLALVWLQTFSEEIGWRGYFLPRAMERFGRWQGLVLQGAAWGLWYAPVLFFSIYGPTLALGSVTRSLALAATCAMLGTLFGWLRLASKSLGPVIIANTTLTLIAGLPYVLSGVDAGLRSAIFGPPGWLVLAAGVGVLLCSRWRAVVRIPERIRLSSETRKTPFTRVWVVLDGRVIDNRSIH
jgi:membrane protease YdiL (CAAX protease family)